jgi:hypothetical protein
MPTTLPAFNDVRKLLAFGSGIGIEIHPDSLEVVVARVRPTGIRVLGRLAIANYAARPAAEWGGEYGRFLRSHGVGYLTATVLLPRREVIVRQLALPGVASKDAEGAIRLQLEQLHPYGEEEIVWGWSPLTHGAVLVGIVRREVMERYRRLFTEAGVLVASFTFSAAAVHAAIRVTGAAQNNGEGFLALGRNATGAVEMYGESVSRPVFSAEFALAPERAAGLALAELRLPPETAPRRLDEILPRPAANPVDHDLSRNALPYATALAGACPRLAPSANVLPPEYRRASSRTALIPTLVLAAMVLLAGGAILLWQNYAQRRYLRELNAEIVKLEPVAARAATLDRQIAKARAQAEMLDRFRAYTRDDLDALNDLTRLIAPPGWANAIDLNRDLVRISGSAPSAAPLVRILDSSPLFQNSVPDAIIRAGSDGENFTIHSNRKVRP